MCVACWNECECLWGCWSARRAGWKVNSIQKFPGPRGVYIQWNGIVEWTTTGMVECFIGQSYLIIQHVLYSEQWALRCALCMHCWLDGWLARLVLHCMNFEPRPRYTFTRWCMQGIQAPQYVSHLITNCHFSFLTYCTRVYNQKVYPGLGQSSKFIHSTCAIHAGCLGMSYEALHNIFQESIPLFHSTISFHWM